MDLKEVRYMLAIERYRTISNAAKALYISQPSLSKYLQNVESQLGEKLFNRIGNEFSPTYLGERYLYYAHKMMLLQEEWDKEADDILLRKEGRLTIALPLMRSSCIIPDTLPAFKKKYPNVNVQIREDTHAVEQMLFEMDDLDFAIFTPQKHLPSLEYLELGKEEILLIMAESHPLAQVGVPRDGCPYPWIDLTLFAHDSFVLHLPEQNTGKIAAQLLEEAGISPPILLQTRNTEMAIQLAATGIGVTFAQASYVRLVSTVQPLACFSIGNPHTEIILAAAYRKGRYLTTYAQDFLTLVQASFTAKTKTE